jgi:2-C-methyl-D-erythritol 2,4-cyclodiphosphate synthase
VGIGSDIHRLVPGRNLVLGGETIPFEKGLDGHSDADVLTHTIIDALLGAASLGDIGQHFPSTDERWRDIRSLELLVKVVALIRSEGFEVVNVDSTIVAEAPPLADWIPEMRNRISTVLGVKIQDVSIKATTSKGLGSVGVVEAISAISVALIQKN